SEEEEISDSDDSEDSDSASDIFADRDEFDHNWEEWHEQAPDTDKIFKRFAVCNMDWDRIRADDLFTVFNSFKSAGGTINSVKIYPSEFGLKRMEAERLNGPPELVEETLEPEAEEKLDKKRAKFHREKLREYQLKRLQYYYAVVECDSPETADHLYVELNGKEFESSSVRFDLRFVPDDTTFDHEPVSEAYKIPDPSEYRPRYFVSTALGQAKVDLTWDETDPQRQEVLERAFKEPGNIEKDLKDYLASSSGESEEEQVHDPEDKKMKLNDRISKYKELLQSLEEKGKEEEEKYDMEISWQPDLKEKTEKLVKQKLEEPKNPFDEMIKKKKEERKLKKQKKNAANKDEEGSNSESDEDYSDASTDEKPVRKENKKLDELYLISDSKKALDQTQEKSSKKKKKKNKQQKSEPEKTQDFKFVEDERFSAIYTSPEFNLDPSDPHFKKTDGNLAIIQEKQRRLKTKEPPSGGDRKSKKAKYW
ncbi:ESF1, partial [Araneus ventricosus]